MSVPTNRDSDKFIVRLPDGMRDRIKAAAEAHSRSMNAEIVATLEENYPAPKAPVDKDTSHRAYTIRNIAKILKQVRTNMVRQLEAGETISDPLGENPTTDG